MPTLNKVTYSQCFDEACTVCALRAPSSASSPCREHQVHVARTVHGWLCIHSTHRLWGLPWLAAFPGCWGAQCHTNEGLGAKQLLARSASHPACWAHRVGRSIIACSCTLTQVGYFMFSQNTAYNFHISSGSEPDRNRILGREEVVLKSNNPLCHQ